MIRGLCADAPLGPILSEPLAAKGFSLFRFGTPTTVDMAAVLEEATRYDRRNLLIVESVADVDAIPSPLSDRWLGVEVLNEPNLHGYTPKTYAEKARPIVARALDRGLRPYVGSIYNTHRASLVWLADVLWRLDARVGVTVHRYPWGRDWSAPAKGFRDRHEETEALLNIIGAPRPWGVSEFGFSTYLQRPPWWKFWQRPFRLTDQSAYEHIRNEYDWWYASGAEFACLYQLNDGPDRDGLEDNFGIRRWNLDPLDWKPQAEAAR